MQTFLPYKSFERSARCLDRARLGKQRVEARQIWRALRRPDYGWQNHPAVRMWRGFDHALGAYYNVMLREWERRSYRNVKLLPLLVPAAWMPPPWLGNRAFHRSHQSNLLRKDPDHYGQFGWRVPDDLDYVWPRC